MRLKSLAGAVLTHPVAHGLLVVLVSIGILNSGYPKIGHDYFSLIRSVDTYLYYLKNGLHIQWWTPWFGGGLPSYPDPIQIQFSLTQFLMFVVNPWLAVIITVFFYMAVGYSSMYFLIRRCLEMSKPDAALGATLFCTCAYMIEHLSAGHLNYGTFVFLPMILWLLIDRSVNRPLSVCLIALSIAYIVNSAGFYFVVIFGLSIPLTIALFYLISSRIRINIGDFSLVILSALGIGLCISISKLLAMQSFLHYFPRVLAAHYAISPAKAITGLLFELFFAPFAVLFQNIPVDHILRRMTGAEYGLWEMDAGLSPIVLFIFCAGLILVKDNPFRRLAGYLFASPRRICALLTLCIVGLLSVEFTVARGFPYTFIKTLPFFSSLHANTRNAAIFIVPIVMSAIFIRQWLEKSGMGGRILNPWLLSLCSIVIFAAYVSVPPRFGHLKVDANMLTQCWKIIRMAPDSLVCKRIMEIRDDRVFIEPASSLFPNLPIMGYELEYFKPEIHPGPVADTNSGYFNLTNPASLVYPKENNLRQFERISPGDKENFVKFINNRQTTWKRPHYQYVADKVSLVSFILTGLVVLFYGMMFVGKKKF
jgi:hypothetical protein